MRKIEGSARFTDEAVARSALTHLVEVRQDPNNELDGGAADLQVNNDGTAVITFSYRVRGNAAKGAADKLTKGVEHALRGGDVEVKSGQVEFDEEQYVDPDTGQVKTQQANRVVQTWTDEDGNERTRTLISKTRLVRAVDDESGEEVGKVAVRTVYDAETGDKVVFEGERGAPEQNVVVQTGN